MPRAILPTSLSQPREEYKYIVDQDRNIFHAKYYMTDNERRDLLADLSSSALVLFEYYLRLACNDKNNPELCDRAAEKAIGLKFHTIRKLRGQLEKTGWIKIVKLPRHPTTGHKAHLYFLGKSAVRSYSPNPPVSFG
jgi:hypothetical protein